MPRQPPERIDFQPDDPAAVLAHMARVDGPAGGWVNVRPVIDPDNEPPPPGLLAMFGVSVHKIPTATWMPPTGERASQTATIGLQHASGPRVAARLAERGHGLPAGWRIVQDHPRRGLVARVPLETPHAAVLDWLVRATGEVCAVPVTGWWRAEVYQKV